jgi:hypothetical protein
MFQYVDQPYAEKLYNEMDRLAFTACFCSVFDECWQTSYNSTAARNHASGEPPEAGRRL